MGRERERERERDDLLINLKNYTHVIFLGKLKIFVLNPKFFQKLFGYSVHRTENVLSINLQLICIYYLL